MRASILSVLQACAAASGSTFLHPRRDNGTTRCPLPGHDDRLASFSVNSDNGLWHCFGCQKSGGIVDLPVAFGLARDRTEASRWLDAKGLIPPAESQGAPEQPKRIERAFIDPADLDEPTLAVHIRAKLDLIDTIGSIRYRTLRDAIGEQRFKLNRERNAMMTEAKRVLKMATQATGDAWERARPHNGGDAA